MMHYNNTHYIYFDGESLNNNRITINTINPREASRRQLSTLDDETTSGTTILDYKDGAKTLSIEGGYQITTTNQDQDFQEIMEGNINRIFSAKNANLRLVPKSKCLTVFEVNTTTGWSVGDDITTTTIDSEYFADENKSYKFTVDVSNSANDYGTATYDIVAGGQSQVDISSYIGANSGYDIPIYLSDSYLISSIEIRLGNDSSNYYSWTATSQDNGKGFKNGWNLLNLSLQNPTETGTVTDTQIDYFRVQIIYDSSQTDFTFNIGETYVYQDKYTRNFTGCYRQSEITMEYNQGEYGGYSNFFSVDLLAPKGYSETTFEFQEFSTTVTTLQSTQSFDYTGSVTAKPTSLITFDSSVSNITDFAIKNLDTGKQIAINDTAFAVGDTLEYDWGNKTVKVNDTQVYYTGQTDDFFVWGKNRVQLNIGQASAQTDNDYLDQDSSTTSGTTNFYFAQSFQNATAGRITYAELIYDYSLSGTPVIGSTKAWQVQLYSDTAGSPGTLLSTATSVVASNVSGSKYRMYGELDYAVSGTTTYWVVFTPGHNLISYVPIYKAYGTTSNVYASGQLKKSANKSTWSTDSVLDGAFRLIVQNSPTHSLTWSMNTKTLNQ